MTRTKIMEKMMRKMKTKKTEITTWISKTATGVAVGCQDQMTPKMMATRMMILVLEANSDRLSIL